MACVLVCLSCLLMARVPSGLGYKCGLMLLSGWGCAKLNMFLHACVIHMHRRAHLDWYLVVAHGAFGVGGLLGPILVYVL